MSARKLGRRIAGLALALAAAMSGVSTATAAQAAGGPAKSDATVLVVQQGDIVWT